MVIAGDTGTGTEVTSIADVKRCRIFITSVGYLISAIYFRTNYVVRMWHKVNMCSIYAMLKV